MKPNKTPHKSAAYADSRRQGRRLPKAKAFLAVLVAFCTVFSLMMPAATLEGQAQAACGLTEHTHDESCCESVLVCGQEEGEAHTHDESCYEEELICQIPEHTHSEECYANPETQSEDGEELGETGAGTETETETKTETGTGTETETETEADQGKQTEPGAETESDDETKADASQKQDTSEDTLTEEGKTENTENAEIAEDAENTQAEEEAAALPDGAEVPEGYTQQYTVRDEENGFAVTVYAPEGALPEDAVLSAELLSEETEEYAVAEQELAEETEAALAENGIDLQSADSADGTEAVGEDGEAAEPSYGFAAMDIHFEDAEGNEIEPAEQVYVVIDAAGLIPEDVDPESVTVQHHAEQEDGEVAVETVADTEDATNGVVAVVENADEAEAKADVQAAFEVDGFSTFTITWTKEYQDRGSENIELDVTYWNLTEDRVLDGPKTPELDLILSSGESFLFENMPVMDEYQFESAKYRNSNNQWETITAVRATQSRQEQWIPIIGKFYTYQWKWAVQINGDDWRTLSGRPSIRLCYTKNSQGGGTVTEDVSVTTGKTVEKKDENYNYDLTLSVTGDRGTESNKVPVDILFIVDRSGSMEYIIDKDEAYPGWYQEDGDWIYKDSRMAGVENAVDTLVTTIESNTGIDAHYSVVGFAGSQYYNGSNYTDYGTTVAQGWTDNGDGVISAVADLSTGGGTNYEQAIYTGTQQLRTNTGRRENAITYVIFISDGIPTYRGVNVENTSGNAYSDPDWGNGNGQNDRNGYNIDAALERIDDMNCNYFYAIGIGPEFGWGETGLNNLNSLCTDVGAEDDAQYYSATRLELLQDAFKEISSSITFFAADHVTMTDPLSEWVDIVPTGNDGTVEFQVKLEKRGADGEYSQVGNAQVVESGKEATFSTQVENESSVSFKMIPVWNEETRTITVTFDKEYQLAPGYRYSVTTTITPNEKAKSTGTDGYVGTGGNNTGTHSGQEGYWSNDNVNAKVTYRVKGEDGEEPFPEPVVQVPEIITGNLTIGKEVTGASVANKEYIFELSTRNPDVAGKTYLFDDGEITFSATPDDENYYVADVRVNVTSNPDSMDGVIEITDLPVGVYVITEDTSPENVAVQGYQFDSVSYYVNDSETNQITINANDNALINIINTYIDFADITILKVNNEGDSLSGAEFQLKNSSGQYYTISKNGEDKETVIWNNTPYTLNSNNNRFVFYDLPDGMYTLIESVAPDGYNLPEIDITFTITNGIITNAQRGTSQIKYTDDTITVTNTTGEELPETGGPGTTILTIGGLLLMAGAVGGGYGLRRRRGKEGR